MESTHYRTGEKALLSYNVSKMKELSNPADLNSAPTGNTCFVLTEIYETKLVFSITLSRPTRIGETTPLLTSGWISAKSRLCPQLPSLTRSGEESGFN
jgi:hypothetical protein